MVATAEKNHLTLRVLSAEEIKYSNDVSAITSYNETGKFDILPFHANFISIINKSIIVHEMGGTLKEFPIETAVLKAFENKVDIFLGIESISLEDLNQAAAAATAGTDKQ